MIAKFQNILNSTKKVITQVQIWNDEKSHLLSNSEQIKRRSLETELIDKKQFPEITDQRNFYCLFRNPFYFTLYLGLHKIKGVFAWKFETKQNMVNTASNQSDQHHLCSRLITKHRNFSGMSIDSFDSIFDQIGHFGRFQILLYFAIAYAAVPSGFNAVASVFLQATPSYHCKVQYNTTLLPTVFNERCNTTSIDQCNEFSSFSLNNLQNNTKTTCQDGYEYDTGVRWWESTVSEFDLVCDRKFLNTVTSSLFFVGFLFGAAIGGYISDNYGRKPAIIIGQFGCIVFGIAAGFAPNWWSFAIFRVLIGCFGNISYVAAFVFCMEVVGPKARSGCGIFVQGFFAIGYALLSLFAYVLPYWRDMQVALAAVSVPMMLIMAFVHESPRYSLIKGDLEATEQALRKIAKGNGKNPNIVQLGQGLVDDVAKATSAGSYGKKFTAIDLFRNGRPMHSVEKRQNGLIFEKLNRYDKLKTVDVPTQFIQNS